MWLIARIIIWVAAGAAEWAELTDRFARHIIPPQDDFAMWEREQLSNVVPIAAYRDKQR